jgi:hypothetical protein
VGERDMTNIIVVTNTREQQSIMTYLREKLKGDYLTDSSVTIVQSGMTRVDVIHTVKGMQHLAARYHVILVPISMSLENLRGFSHQTNININPLLKRLDAMKAEAIAFVNSHKLPDISKQRHKEVFAKTMGIMFNKEG